MSGVFADRWTQIIARNKKKTSVRRIVGNMVLLKRKKNKNHGDSVKWVMEDDLKPTLFRDC